MQLQLGRNPDDKAPAGSPAIRTQKVGCLQQLGVRLLRGLNEECLIFAFEECLLEPAVWKECWSAVEECWSAVEECWSGVVECWSDVEEYCSVVEECWSEVEECWSAVEECWSAVEECWSGVEEYWSVVEECWRDGVWLDREAGSLCLVLGVCQLVVLLTEPPKLS